MGSFRCLVYDHAWLEWIGPFPGRRKGDSGYYEKRICSRCRIAEYR